MSTLFQFTCAQMLLYGLMWTAAWAILRDERRAVLHWLTSSLLLSAGLALIALRPDGNPWFTFVLANLLLVVSVVALWRGCAIFLGLPLHDWEQALLLLAVAVVLCMLGPVPRTSSWRHPGFFTSAAVGWVMAATVWRSHAAFVVQFGRRTAGMALTPYVVFAALMALRAGQGLLTDAVAPVYPSHGSDLFLVYAVLMVTAVFNLMNLFLIVLRLLGRLTHLVEHDALTGLLNRRAMQQQLEREWRRWQRMGQPFSVVSVDIDHFKRVNDHWGHPAGDEVLRCVAGRLQRAVRQVDQLARMGGEEFLVLMPGCGHETAVGVAERLRGVIAAQPVLVAVAGLPDVPVTASLGIAVADAADADLDRLLQRADLALYAAKHAGRDRVAIAPPAVAAYST